MKRVKIEKMEEYWGVETELKKDVASGGYKNIDGTEAST